LFDVVLLVLLLLCIARGYRAGFFMGIKNIVSVILGFMISFGFSKPLALFLSQHTTLSEKISSWLTEKLSAITFQPDLSATGFFSGLPEILQKQMLHLFPQQSLLASAPNLLDWLTNLLTGCIAFAVLLAASTLLLRVLAYTLSKTMDATLPSYMLNHTAGAVLYAVQFCLVFMAVLYVTRPLLLTGTSINVPALVSLQQAVDHSLFVQALEGLLKALGWM